MAPTGFNAETFGVIQRRDGLQLGYFNGPWIARIFLVTVAIWWSLSEIARLHLFKRTALLQHCMAEKRESGTPRQVRNRDHRFFDEAKNGGKAKKVNRYTNASPSLMASKLSVLIVGFLVLSFVVLVASIERPIKESEASYVHIGVPCDTNDDCIGPCGRNSKRSTCEPDGCCCITT
ncbi:PPR repeat [Musa troglodytarum]|uniref:PPR repeat n=1 Tax=Musa troglodytarum TaxID=320322 RepID=A0A9E7EH23_9LILI|nr:PPR repeat [Musa troglodytarum]